MNALRIAISQGCELDTATSGIVLNVCEKARQWETALAFLVALVAGRHHVDIAAYNTVLSACGKGEQWTLALDMLSSLPERRLAADKVTYNVAINAIGKGGHWQQALEFLASMRPTRLEPDAITFTAAINACARQAEWRPALMLLAESGFRQDRFAINAALGACDKAGRWMQALALIEDMQRCAMETDATCYGVVASACERGRAVDASVRLALSVAGAPIAPAQAAQAVQAAGALAAAVAVAAEAYQGKGPAKGFAHVPVMVDEVVEAFSATVPNGVILDATMGGGGHSEALLQRLPGIRLVGIDKDPLALRAARIRLASFGERVHLIRGDFADAPALLARSPFAGPEGCRCVGILADLGVSSPQLDQASRGFSFKANGPLDMRMDALDENTRPASWYLANLEAGQLARHIEEYGGEDPVAAQSIATWLTRVQPQTTQEAASLIEGLAPRLARASVSSSGLHPATKTFQALRILVNRETENLDRLLRSSAEMLAPGGLICCISFHSLEDDIVRRYLRGSVSRDGDKLCATASHFVPASGRDGLRPSTEEVARNPRSRSARLRMAVRRA